MISEDIGMDENKEGEAPVAQDGTQTATQETPAQLTNDKGGEPQTHRFHLPPLKEWFHLGQTKQPEIPKNPGPPTGSKIYEPGSPEEKDRLGN